MVSLFIGINNFGSPIKVKFQSQLLLRAYYSLHQPQRVIARSVSDEAIPNNEIATPSGLAMTTFDDSKCNLFYAPSHNSTLFIKERQD